MKMFSGLGTIMERIKEEHDKNNVQDDSDFIDQQDFEEHVALNQAPENNDFTQLQHLIDKLPLGTSMDSVQVEDVGFSYFDKTHNNIALLNKDSYYQSKKEKRGRRIAPVKNLNP